jgi:hypothetical protein
MLRSNWAVSHAELDGLKAWIRAYSIGTTERAKPWRVLGRNGIADSHSIAAWLGFCAGRIGQDVAAATVAGAADLLMARQQQQGFWTRETEDSAPSIFTTCCAIHALAVLRPAGWQRVCGQGARWLRQQRHSFGYWTDSVHIPEFLTVLVLDSLSLADTGNAITFDVALSPADPVLGPVSRTPWEMAQVTADQRAALHAGLVEFHATFDDLDVPDYAQPSTVAADTRALDVQLVEHGSFYVNVAERIAMIPNAMVDAWLQHGPLIAVLTARLTLVHEVHHHRQNLESTNYAGIGRAGVVLEDVDARADRVAAGCIARWLIRRAGAEAVDHRQLALNVIEAVLAGIEIFDHIEQGTTLQRLYERRLRRYLAWHMQLARTKTVRTLPDFEMLLREHLLVELAPLNGALDARGDKIVTTPQPETHLAINLGGRLARAHRSPSFDPTAILAAVRSFDRAAIQQNVTAVRDAHQALLLPWLTASARSALSHAD